MVKHYFSVSSHPFSLFGQWDKVLSINIQSEFTQIMNRLSLEAITCINQLNFFVFSITNRKYLSIYVILCCDLFEKENWQEVMLALSDDFRYYFAE